jgi:predicted RNA-binding protein YlxR (DUF448 family)
MSETNAAAAKADNMTATVRIAPERMCVICRRRFPKSTLTRYTLALQENLIIDSKKNRPGRGWYLCSDPGCAFKFAKYRPGKRRKGKQHV